MKWRASGYRRAMTNEPNEKPTPDLGGDSAQAHNDKQPDGHDVPHKAAADVDPTDSGGGPVFVTTFVAVLVVALVAMLVVGIVVL